MGADHFMAICGTGEDFHVDNASAHTAIRTEKFRGDNQVQLVCGMCGVHLWCVHVWHVCACVACVSGVCVCAGN